MLTKPSPSRPLKPRSKSSNPTLESGEDILISGFGKLCVKEKKERKGRNPATGKGLMLGARRVVTFKCSGLLRDKINAAR